MDRFTNVVRRNTAMRVSIVLLAAWALDSARAVQSAAVDSLTETTDLPELEVVGKRLYEMKLEVIRTEDKFLARYNDLNKNDDFDVQCGPDALLGTRIKQRICRVQFYERAQTEYARSLLTGDLNALPPEMVALQRREEYKKNALKVINADPELRRLLRLRDALEQKYVATRKESFKKHWLAF